MIVSSCRQSRAPSAGFRSKWKSSSGLPPRLSQAAPSQGLPPPRGPQSFGRTGRAFADRRAGLPSNRKWPVWPLPVCAQWWIGKRCDCPEKILDTCLKMQTPDLPVANSSGKSESLRLAETESSEEVAGTTLAVAKPEENRQIAAAANMGSQGRVLKITSPSLCWNIVCADLLPCRVSMKSVSKICATLGQRCDADSN